MFLRESNKIATSLLEILSYRAQYQPDQQAYIFLQNGETESGSLTYGELDRQAKAIATHLQSWQGERALLIYPSGLEFITAFFGCLYAGVVAVPVYPPRRNQNLSRLLSIVNNAQAKIALTTTSILADLDRRWEEQTDLAQLKLIDTDTLASNFQEFAPQLVKPETLAFLQYTSGSTGTPKGVMVTHGNIIHNQQLIQQAFSHSEETIFVGWLPLFHDMGLIGNVMQPMYLGIPCILMPPVAFLQQPIRWLQAISKYRATTSGGPNFAYDLCVKKIRSAELTDLDLSSWDLAFSGAEPVRAETLTQFSQKFANCGFNYNAFYPCYGMAETTLLATGGDKTQPPVIQEVLAEELEQNSIVEAEISSSQNRVFVGCGRSYLNTTVIIVNPESLIRCQTGQVGEIWVANESIAAGYWERPEATKETFQAYLKETREGPFVRTGDLGFLDNEELFVTGRLKDVIIIRGRNHYPQDIELTVEKSHPALRENSSAAFAVEIDGEEGLVVVCEVERTYLRKLNIDEIVREIEIAISTEYELNIHGIVLLKTGSIPKTSSGKIQRRACKVGFLAGTLNFVEQWQKNLELKSNHIYVAPKTANEEIIANIFASVLSLERVGIYDNFFELGGHSLLVTQSISRLRVAFELEISIRDIFEFPTISQLSQKISQLQSLGQGLKLAPIESIAKDLAQSPLSFAQERMWFLNQFEGASATYNMPAALRLSGELNLDAFNQALAEIVRRHEVLRTSFTTVNGIPMQAIHPSTSMTIDTIDLQHLTETEREVAISQHIQQSALAPFDLEIAPLICWSLLQASAHDYVFCVNMHHIISDGWSIGVLVQELSDLYSAYCAGNSSPLSELAIQYADFALWQRQYLSGAVLEQQLQYWISQLQGAPELLQLPTDRPRPSVQTYRGATANFTLSPELTQQLQALSRRTGSTLFMTLMAAFATLLYRYSGESDVVIGSPIANRNRSEIESLIGFFVNTLVLRTRLEDHLSFEQLLQQVRETMIAAYEHQDVPFEQLVEALQPQRSMSHSPLFQVMFALQNAPMSEIELPGLTLSELHADGTIAKFDLTLSMSESSMGLGCEWEYNTDLFDKSTIERMASHFENLLSAIVENPQQPVSELPLLTPTERQQLLVEWNDTQTNYPQDKCIHQLFEKQVAKTPDALAVVFEEQELTYQQLNERANQLAHYLQTFGVKPEVLVGICVERSLEMVVGLLGILKAGGAYVPLDPSYPAERLSYMLSDAGIEVLLTQENLLSVLPSHTAQVVCLDADWGEIASHSQENVLIDASAENLAYVIYTSGSTGQPKGVLVAHKGLLNLVVWHQTTFGITSSDIATQLAGTAFDATVWELWPYLSAGAIIHLLQPETVTQPKTLQDLLISRQVTITFIPTPLLANLLTLEWPRSTALRFVLTGGDKLNQYPLTTLPFSLINNYGPTENTVVTTSGPIDVIEATKTSPPIGSPIANTQVYILDRQMQPVPIGVSGELHIGGDGLARGYLNRPELTELKFVPNPFSPDKSARLYKTGDLARYQPDGNIEFLGRIDHQVKIRGFRIELGEIETVLSSHPQVQQAVAVATSDPNGNKRLVAYVVGSENEDFNTQQLREFLQQQLPAYMVPSTFIKVETFPLTPNGKFDRNSLSILKDLTVNIDSQYIPPQNATEELLSQMWSELLNNERAGVNDNFFDLGGHSLLATQLISDVHDIFDVELPLRTVFEQPTIESLAKAVQQSNQNTLPIIPIARDNNLLQLSFGQQRLWFLNQLEGYSATHNITIALCLKGQLDLSALKHCLNTVVQRHEVLRTHFTTVDQIAVQIIAPQLEVQVPIIDLQDLCESQQQHKLEQLIVQEAQEVFDLSTGSLLRVKLIRISPLDHEVLLTLHHIIFDGRSVDILVCELAALYHACITNTPVELPELPIQYADFAYWQRQWLQGEVLQSKVDYWKKQLDGAPSLLELPTDYPRSAVLSYNGKQLNFSVSAHLLERLQNLTHQHGVTLFMVLLSAYAVLVSRYSGQKDIIVGSPISNRNRGETENLIGLLSNTLAFRIDLNDDPSFENLLKRVKSIVLGADKHKDLPFEKLVEELQFPSSPSYSPIFKVMLVLQNLPLESLQLPALKLNISNIFNVSPALDLSLTFWKKADGLVLNWDYNGNLFKQDTIINLNTDLLIFLETISAL